MGAVQTHPVRVSDSAVGAYYIVTDLDVRAGFELDALHAGLSQAGLHGRVDVFEGVWSGGYSSSKRGCGSPDEAIDVLVSIVEALGAEARNQWDRCTSRQFNMGFEGFNERFHSTWLIPAPLLQRMAAVNGDLVVTIYRVDEANAVAG